VSTVTATRPIVVDTWTYRPCPQPAGTARLVCFPHAGGDVTAFTELAAAVAPELEVWAVRLPARGGRFVEPMPGRFAALVAAVAAGIAPHLGPGVMFYGQSFGALLAYEVARRLPAVLAPDVVVAACAAAPQAWPGSLPADDEGAAQLLRECGLTVDHAIRDMVIATIRADLTACRDYCYRPDPLPRFAIHALAGADDPAVRPGDVAGWAAVTAGPFTASVEPGGHLLATPFSAGPGDLLRVLGGIHADRHG
jgi:pyochelin biosynthesis protein PchC